MRFGGLTRSDGDLLAAVCGGDGSAFSVFYRRYLPRVVGLLVRESGDREVAADLAAEVFAAVLLSAQQSRALEDGTAWPWLRGIAQNKLHESWRRGRVEERARRELGFEPELIDDADLARVEELASSPRVIALLGELPEHHRAAVQARVIDERSYAIDFKQYPDGITAPGGADLTDAFTRRSAQATANLLAHGALPVILSAQ